MLANETLLSSVNTEFPHLSCVHFFLCLVVVWNPLVPFGKICTWKISHTFRPSSEQLLTIMFPMMLSGACAAGVLSCYCGVSVVVTSAGDTADSICPGSELLCGDWILETVNRLTEPYCRQQHLCCQLASRTDPYTCMPVVN